MSFLMDLDRKKGVLTTKDRHYLFGETDMSTYDDPKNVAKQRRYQIRGRIENALLDLVVANNLLSKRDQARIFDSLQESMEREQFEHVISELFDFLYSNLPVGHRRGCASLGIAKSYHLGALTGTGMQYNRRPIINIQVQDMMKPDDFHHPADIARYYADIERLSEARPNPPKPLSEMPEDPPKDSQLPDLYASPIEAQGFDLEEADQDNRKQIYQRRIEFLELLDNWDI